MKQLDGKVAIITGANQGLGLQIANHYINNGANIAICARNKSKLFNVKKTLELTADCGTSPRLKSIFGAFNKQFN